MRPTDIVRPDVLGLLRKYQVAPLVAAPDEGPAADGEVLTVVRTCREVGLTASGVWPLLTAEAGYWPSERAPEEFAVRVARLAAAKESAPPGWLLVDLEPPLQAMRRVRSPLSAAPMLASNLAPDRYRRGRAAFAALAASLRAKGVRTLACAAPLVAGDFARGGAFWQDAWESPLVDVGWDAVGLMVYTTLLVERSGGLLDARAARRFAYRVAVATRVRFGAGAAALVGLCGDGVLGGEAAYAEPDELEADVAAMRAAGITDVIAYSLEGILGRPEPEQWFAALATRRVEEPRSRRGDAVWGAVAAVGSLTAWYGP